MKASGLRGQNNITIKRFGAGSRLPYVPGLPPQFRGILQVEGFNGDKSLRIGKAEGFETLYLSRCFQSFQLAQCLIVSNGRNTDNIPGRETVDNPLPTLICDSERIGPILPNGAQGKRI